MVAPGGRTDYLQILHIDTGTRWRGGQQQVWWLLEGLQRAGISQTLVASPDSELARRADALRRNSAKLKIVHLSPSSSRTLSFENARIVRDAAAWCDLIHAHDAHAHTLAWGAQKMSRRRLPPVIVARRVSFAIPWLGRLKNRTPAWFIAVSEFVRGQLIASGIAPAMIRAVHDGVAVPASAITAGQRAAARQQLALADGCFVLGTLSSIAPEKMLDATLQWVASLPSHFHFLLGVPESQAAGEPVAALHRLAGQLDCRARFRIVPVAGDTSTLLSAMDVFVYFSNSEGLGSAILLAMAHGLPVIASRTGGIPEIVSPGETGVLIDTVAAGWQAPARQALLELEADAAARNRFGTRARAYAAEQAGSDNMVARTLDIYRQILAARAEESGPT